MTDKQIIIDGVDVSEWTDEEVRYKFEKHSPKAIRQIAFDLYKQLKRKEQECEELKNDVERWKSNFNGKVSAIEELLQQLDQLKQTNEELQKENEDFKKQVNDLLNKPEIQDKILWKIDNEALLGSKDAWIYKLEQTLAKIKEIAENMNNECFYSDFDCKYCDMKNGCTYHRKIKILQKISECEVENEIKRNY